MSALALANQAPPEKAPKLTIFRPSRYVTVNFRPSPYSQAWEDRKRQNPKLAKFLGLDAEPPRQTLVEVKSE